MKLIVRPALAGFSVAVMMAAVAVAPAQKKAPAPKKAPVGAVNFASVEKIVKPKCAGCHNAAAPAGGVNLSSYDATMKSKYKGKTIVVPKKAKDSILVKSLHGDGVLKMPLGGALSAAEIKTFEDWVAAGAKK